MAWFLKRRSLKTRTYQPEDYHDVYYRQAYGENSFQIMAAQREMDRKKYQRQEWWENLQFALIPIALIMFFVGLFAFLTVFGGPSQDDLVDSNEPHFAEILPTPSPTPDPLSGTATVLNHRGMAFFEVTTQGTFFARSETYQGPWAEGCTYASLLNFPADAIVTLEKEMYQVIFEDHTGRQVYYETSDPLECISYTVGTVYRVYFNPGYDKQPSTRIRWIFKD